MAGPPLLKAFRSVIVEGMEKGLKIRSTERQGVSAVMGAIRGAPEFFAP